MIKTDSVELRNIKGYWLRFHSDSLFYFRSGSWQSAIGIFWYPYSNCFKYSSSKISSWLPQNTVLHLPTAKYEMGVVISSRSEVWRVITAKEFWSSSKNDCKLPVFGSLYATSVLVSLYNPFFYTKMQVWNMFHNFNTAKFRVFSN